MCSLCLKTPCDSRCPNAPEPKPVVNCKECGVGIFEGEARWLHARTRTVSLKKPLRKLWLSTMNRTVRGCDDEVDCGFCVKGI